MIVRNTICFAYEPGTFDAGLVLHQESAMNSGLWLYNNLVADHRRFGIDLTATGDSFLLLRNNVVVNHPAAITPEPAAYHSSVDRFVTVVSSHNTAFASAVATKIELQDSDQDIANSDQPDFVQRNRNIASLAFYQTRWNIVVAADPNWNLFRLRDGGSLHDSVSGHGITVGNGVPSASDIAIIDDLEKDARPSNHGGVSHTDRGPDQFRPLTAGDITVNLRPRLAGLEPIRMDGGGFGIVAVGPQEDLPELGTVMLNGRHTAGGRIRGIAGQALAVPQPVSLIIRPEVMTPELTFAWPVSAESYRLEETTTIGGADAAPGWTPVAAAPTVEGDEFTVRVTPMTTGNRFYRLRKSD